MIILNFQQAQFWEKEKSFEKKKKKVGEEEKKFWEEEKKLRKRKKKFWEEEKKFWEEEENALRTRKKVLRRKEKFWEGEKSFEKKKKKFWEVAPEQTPPPQPRRPRRHPCPEPNTSILTWLSVNKTMAAEENF